MIWSPFLTRSPSSPAGWSRRQPDAQRRRRSRVGDIDKIGCPLGPSSKRNHADQMADDGGKSWAFSPRTAPQRGADLWVISAADAIPPVWKVRMVSWVPGSPIDWAAMMPTASPMATGWLRWPGWSRSTWHRRRFRLAVEDGADLHLGDAGGYNPFGVVFIHHLIPGDQHFAGFGIHHVISHIAAQETLGQLLNGTQSLSMISTATMPSWVSAVVLPDDDILGRRLPGGGSG